MLLAAFVLVIVQGISELIKQVAILRGVLADPLESETLEGV